MRIAHVLAASMLVLMTSSEVVAAAGSDANHAKRYYLSVGDSLAAGVQPIGDPDNGFRTDQGYPEQLTAIARGGSPKLALVKLGCPGETSATMRTGGLCAYPHGSQLDEAVAFLRSHRQRIAFVTIDIGANDFPCQDPSCVPAGIASIAANLPPILEALRIAAGPDVPIVGMTIYNPFLAGWLAGPDGAAMAQLSASVMAELNAFLRASYPAAGAAVADVDGAFASNDFTLVDVPGLGLVPLNVARICQWTWVCAPPPLGPDNHANAAGYGAIAAAFATALGL